MYVRDLRKTDSKSRLFNSLGLDFGLMIKNNKKISGLGVYGRYHILKSFYILEEKSRREPVLLHFNAKNEKDRIVLLSNLLNKIYEYSNSSLKLSFELKEEDLNLLRKALSKVDQNYKIELVSNDNVVCVGSVIFKKKPIFKSKYFKVIAALYLRRDLSVYMYDFLKDLKEILTVNELDIVKEYAFDELNKRNLNNLSRMHSDFLVNSKSTVKLLVNREKFLPQALLDKGFVEKSHRSVVFSRPYNKEASFETIDKTFFIEGDSITYHKTLKFQGFKYYAESISKYRFFLKKMQNHLNQNSNADYYTVFDHEGYMLTILYKGKKPTEYIPLCYKKAFYSKINSLKMLERLKVVFERYDLRKHAGYYKETFSFFEFFAEKSRSYLSEEEILRFFEDLIIESFKDETDSSAVIMNIENRLYSIYPLMKNQNVSTKGIFVKLYREDPEIIKKYSIFLEFISDRKLLGRSHKGKMSHIIRNNEELFEPFLVDLFLSEFDNKGIVITNYEREALTQYISSIRSSRNCSTNDIYVMFNAFEQAVKKVDFFKLIVLIEPIFREYDLNLYKNLNGYLLSVLYEVSTNFNLETAIEFAKQWSLYLKQYSKSRPSISSLIHDTGYLYLEILRLSEFGFQDFLTKEIVFHLGTLSPSKLNKTVEEVNSFKFYFSRMEVGKDALAQKMIELVLNGESLVDLLAELEVKYIEFTIKEDKAFEGLDLESCANFILRMKKYKKNISILSLIHEFEDKAVDILKGTIEGVFTPKPYYLVNDSLKEVVHRELANKGANSTISNPKRLFSHLNKIRRVSDLLEGKCSLEELLSIVNIFKNLGVTYDSNLVNESLVRGLIEPKCSPEFLIAGDASVCCMSFGSSNAYDYALEKGFGVFNVYYKDRIVANSVIWINSHFNSLVIDNVEVHPNYEHLEDQIKSVYIEMIEDTLIQYNLDFAVQGSRYNDLVLSDKTTNYRHLRDPFEIEEDFYTDASQVIPLEIGALTRKEIVTILKNGLVERKEDKTALTFTQM